MVSTPLCVGTLRGVRHPLTPSDATRHRTSRSLAEKPQMQDLRSGADIIPSDGSVAIRKVCPFFHEFNPSNSIVSLNLSTLDNADFQTRLPVSREAAFRAGCQSVSHDQRIGANRDDNHNARSDRSHSRPLWVGSIGFLPSLWSLHQLERNTEH